MNKIKHIVSVSGGGGSALAAERVVEKFGKSKVVFVFADTNTESDDLYELLKFMQAHHDGVEFVHLTNQGRNIWDVFDAQGIIRTPTGACKASIELKHKAIAHWIVDNYTPLECILYTGLDHTESLPGTRGEPSRQERFQARWLPYRVEHPLNWTPRLSACQIRDAIRRLGYPAQSLYERGYPHNNCGGACILAGLGQWHGLYLDYPERFLYHETREEEFNEKHRKNRKPFTVLRNQALQAVLQSDGEIKMERHVEPLSLGEFRRRIEENDQSLNLRDFRSTCGCMHGVQGNLFGNSQVTKA